MTKKNTHKVKQRFYKVFRKLAYFKDFPDDTLKISLSKCFLISLETNAVLLNAGQENHNLYLLLKGQLKVHLESVGSDEGFLIETGEYVGEISIIDGKPVTAYVVAEKPSRLLVIPEEVLWLNFFQIPEVTRNFMRQMAERFRRRNAVMQSQFEQELRFNHLKNELAIAKDIQSSMLPCNRPLFPHHLQVDVAASMWPAKEVGGDFYNAFPLDKERICVAIGDVSGKGVPAALFMVRVMTLLRSEMMHNEDLNRTVEKVNRSLCEDNDTCMFVTLIIVVLNVVTGEYTMINGGHIRPLFKANKKPFQYKNLPRGILLGVKADTNYETQVGIMTEGDIFLLYTDGVTEAMNPAGDFYSEERLLALLNRELQSDPARLTEEVTKEIENFADNEPQFDDITLLALRYNGQVMEN